MSQQLDKCFLVRTCSVDHSRSCSSEDVLSKLLWFQSVCARMATAAEACPSCSSSDIERDAREAAWRRAGGGEGTEAVCRACGIVVEGSGLVSDVEEAARVQQAARPWGRPVKPPDGAACRSCSCSCSSRELEICAEGEVCTGCGAVAAVGNFVSTVTFDKTAQGGSAATSTFVPGREAGGGRGPRSGWAGQGGTPGR